MPRKKATESLPAEPSTTKSNAATTKKKPKTPAMPSKEASAQISGKASGYQAARRVDTSKLPKMFKCVCCGATYANSARDHFYIMPKTKLFSANDNYSCFCIDCTNNIYAGFASEAKDPKLALAMMCATTGWYFSEKLYETLAQKADEAGEPNALIPIGVYLRYLNGRQYDGKTFPSYIAELYRSESLFTPKERIREVMEENWSPSDKRNMRYIVEALGYDCFNDIGYSQADRKFLYNTMTGYLTDEVLEDPHKMQSVINIVKASLQVAQFDILINKQIKSAMPDIDEVKRMVDTKTGLQHSINAMAKDNAISAVGSGKRASSTNALTAIMKEMLDAGIDEAKANVVDTKMTDAYQKIASISAKALVQEMNFTSDEYAKMVAEQSIIVQEQAQKLMETEEQLRQTNILLDMAYRLGFNPSKVQDEESTEIDFTIDDLETTVEGSVEGSNEVTADADPQ